MTKFQSVEGSRVVRRSSARPAAIADFLVPFLQATATALVLLLVAWYAGYRDVGAGLGTGAWIVMFIWRITQSDKTCPQIEELFGVDLNHDRQIGEPDFVVVDPNRAIDEARQEQQRSEVQRWHDFITLAAQGKTSLKQLAPYGFSRREVEDRRIKLISWGIADWKDYKNKSWKLILPLDKALASFQEHTAPHKWGE